MGISYFSLQCGIQELNSGHWVSGEAPQSTEASDWSSCIPGWPQIPHVEEEDFELLILLLPFPKD